MATRSAHTFENKFNEGNEVKDAQIIEPRDFTRDVERENHLWTIVDPMIQSGQQFFIAGFCRANAIGYFYSIVPWRGDYSDGAKTRGDIDDEYRRW